jgi:hypothetical protein
MDTKADLYCAFAKAQGAFPAIPKNRTVKITTTKGGAFEFRYADLEGIISATRPALVANGLVLFQTTRMLETGVTLLVTTLAHSSGDSIVSEYELQPAEKFLDTKQFGATITYLRRYAVSAILGVAADDDLDQDGRGVEDDVDMARITTDLCAKATACETDAEALALWKANQKELADFPGLHKQFKSVVEARRLAIKEGSK